MKSSDKLAMKCFAPVVVKRNGVVRMVRCGRCPYCMSLRSAELKKDCIFETNVSKSAYFITLTYSKETIPRMLCRKNEALHKDNYDVFDITPRLNDYYEGDVWLGSFRMQSQDYADLSAKLNSHPTDKYSENVFPYLFPVDLQLFLKRFRKYANKKYDIKKVRYFAIGEYGPKRFRPHWHLLLWFNEKVPSSTVEKLVLGCWRYGRCSIDLVQGSVTDYVTSYSTGSQLVPPLYELQSTRPRVFHSLNFGGQIYDRIPIRYKINGEDEPTVPERVCVSCDGSIKEYWILRQMENRWLPRCVGYSQKSKRMRRLSYDLYPITQSIFRDSAGADSEHLKTLVDVIMLSKDNIELKDVFIWYSNHIRYKVFHSTFFRRSLKSEYPHLYEDVCQLLDNSKYREFWSKYSELRDLYSHCYDIYMSECLYRELLISRKFHYICSVKGVSPDVLQRNIDVYYSRKEYKLMTEALQHMESNGYDGTKSAFAVTYYDDLYIHTKSEDLPEYNEFVSHTIDNILQHRKHKELNDLNNQFCYSLNDSFRRNYSRSYVYNK